MMWVSFSQLKYLPVSRLIYELGRSTRICTLSQLHQGGSILDCLQDTQSWTLESRKHPKESKIGGSTRGMKQVMREQLQMNMLSYLVCMSVSTLAMLYQCASSLLRRHSYLPHPINLRAQIMILPFGRQQSHLLLHHFHSLQYSKSSQLIGIDKFLNPQSYSSKFQTPNAKCPSPKMRRPSPTTLSKHNKVRPPTPQPRHQQPYHFTLNLTHLI